MGRPTKRPRPTKAHTKRKRRTTTRKRPTKFVHKVYSVDLDLTASELRRGLDMLKTRARRAKTIPLFAGIREDNGRYITVYIRPDDRLVMVEELGRMQRGAPLAVRHAMELLDRL